MAIEVGTAGADRLNGTSGWDQLHGLAGDDQLNGGQGGDTLSGGLGNDLLRGGSGPDTLHGGEGRDTFEYGAFSEARDDRIVDFSVEDLIDFSAIPASRRHFIGSEQFSGRSGEIRDDVQSLIMDIDGDALGDIVLNFDYAFNFVETSPGSGQLMMAVDQVLEGRAQADILSGGAGNDSLFGGAGDDSLVGGRGDDSLYGDEGADLLEGGPGYDSMSGGAGEDVFRFASLDEIAGDSITDIAPGDELEFAFSGVFYIGDNPFSGVPGEYRFESQYLYHAGYLFQVVFDTDGDTWADRSLTLNDAESLMLEETAPGSNRLRVVENQVLTGTAGDDTLIGGGGQDSLFGLAGNDWLDGGLGRDQLDGDAGNDTLIGDAGEDVLDGGEGDDWLTGGWGWDVLTGGIGNDGFQYLALEELGLDWILDFGPGDRLDLSALSQLTFVGLDQDFSGAGNEIRLLHNGYEVSVDLDIDGDKTSDFGLIVRTGFLVDESAPGSRVFEVIPNQVLIGGVGQDSLVGGNGHDTLLGLDGEDALCGNGGMDTLDGGVGNDVLDGGLGNDILIGGMGNDSFRYSALGELGFDWIVDFGPGDRLDLSAIADLTFVGLGKDFSGAGHEIRVVENFGETSLEIDIDGDQVGDLAQLIASGCLLDETTPGSLVFQLSPQEGLFETPGALEDPFGLTESDFFL